MVNRWREAEIRGALDAAWVPMATVQTRGQGLQDGGEAVRAFDRACLEEGVVPRSSLLTRVAMAEARVAVYPDGNSKLAKNRQGGRRARARDDAAAAAILAVSARYRQDARPARRGLRFFVA